MEAYTFVREFISKLIFAEEFIEIYFENMVEKWGMFICTISAGVFEVWTYDGEE